MPYIECHIATGLTKARKTQLIRDIVEKRLRGRAWRKQEPEPGRSQALSAAQTA